MERLLQIYDDLDDLIGIVGLARERIRSLVLATLFALVSLSLQVAGVLMALSHPPLALGLALMMFVLLFYRFVTSGHALRAASGA